MPLGDILCASLDQCNIPGLRERKKDFRLVNLICKIWQFYGNMWQIYYLYGKIWDIKWEISDCYGAYIIAK